MGGQWENLVGKEEEGEDEVDGEIQKIEEGEGKKEEVEGILEKRSQVKFKHTASHKKVGMTAK